MSTEISSPIAGWRAALLLALGSLLLPVALQAHHGDAGRYEETMTTVTGKVVEFSMVNPHSLIVLDVTDSGGNVERWQLETGNPTGLRRQNFTPETVRIGATITVTARRRKNGEPYMSITGGASVTDASGTPIYSGD